LAPGEASYRILIAEDQPDNRLLLNKLMTDLGLEVKTAENGKECLAIVKKWQPDLILMDQRMPVFDGMETTRRIRQLPGGDKVKIVAVTASAFKEQQAEMLAAGMDGFVSKPYQFDEIFDSLAQQLGLRFIYADETTERMPTTLKAESLAVLEGAVRTELRTALESLDVNAIAAAIQHVGEFDADLAQILLKIANSLDYPKILSALNLAEQAKRMHQVNSETKTENGTEGQS
jgi:CheY-like chemotaxis protein